MIGLPISEEILTRWQLTDASPIFADDAKAIYAADSAQFGAVIVKLDADDRLQREFFALSRLGGAACRVYGYETGVLLEERILPGTPLRQEKDFLHRMEALAQVLDGLHVPAEDGETYLDWLDAACAITPIPKILEEKGERAHNICRELFEKNPERVLLHGDLHHDNILRRADGSYAVIDPKGVIGPPILDLPRFLLNEPTETVRDALLWMHRRFGYLLEDICKAYWMEAVLANLWLAEDGLPLQEEKIRLAEEIMEEIDESSKG